MFAAPAEIPTRIFATLPDRYRMSGRRSAWADANRGGACLHSFLEGPSFDRMGNLYVTDIPFGRIFRIAPDGAVSLVAEYDGWPNGLRIHRDGRIFVADRKNGIVVVDPATGAVAPLLEHRWSERFKGPNDLFFSSRGDLYFTDQGQTGLHDPTGRVYRYTAEGRLETLLACLPSPNGLVLAHDETALLVAASRANAIWRLPLLADGSTEKVSLFIQMSGGGGPDGLALDAGGGLAVCHSGLGAVWIFSALGEPLYRLRSCAGLNTTNLAYGGSGMRTLYVTESATGSILCADVPTPGKPLYSHT